MLNFHLRHNDSEYSNFSLESRKKLHYLKLVLFLGIALLSFLVYYFQLLPVRYQELMSYFLVMSVSCNLVPIPTYPFILYVSHDYAVWLIVLVGTIGSTISAIIEYYFIDFLMRFDRFARLKETEGYHKYIKYFDRFSFRSIMLASVLPLPLDVIRIMAIMRRYAKWKYLTATFIGRIPRIFIFALLGSQLAYTKTIAIALLVITLLIEVVRRLVKLIHRVPVTSRIT